MVSRDALEQIYGSDWQEAAARYENLERQYRNRFGQEADGYFTAPGRTEIIGNHTDHNGGKILAASITLDTICAAGRSKDAKITIVSEGYKRKIEIDLDHLDQVPKGQGSLSLVAGIIKCAREMGYQAEGFRAYVSTKVIAAAGVSSSASFEMLICAVINHFFNGGKISCADCARMGQYAENRYWDKASGLMDQMACAVGGTILLDFSDGVKYEKVDFGFDQLGCDLVIINTGKGHSDLSAEYSSIPQEMRAVADALNAENLCGSNEEILLGQLPEIRRKLENDRALLRALHYYEECRRVDEAAASLQTGNKEKLLELIRESGNSSWKWLQNGYCIENPQEQAVTLALALAEIYMRKNGRGVCRIHGGGFAGVIMCVLPKEDTEDFVRFMEPFFGRENIYPMGIRQNGAGEVK